MKEDLLKIINNYGVMNQLEYYQSEVWELEEAVFQYDAQKEACENIGCSRIHIDKCKEHIAEELADNYVMLYQFKLYYEFEFEIPKDIIFFDSNPLRYFKILNKSIYRLNQAIIESELFKRLNDRYTIFDKIDIENRLKQVLYELRQFQYYYGITDEQIEEIMLYKIDRQLKRMEGEE